MTIWFYSDPHVDHEALVQGKDGRPSGRPEFSSARECAETFVARHNAVVKPEDHSYCLGDFAMGLPGLREWAPKLHGHRRLILGNHDLHGAKLYAQFFGKVLAFRELDGLMFSHMPIAPWSMRWRANVHGHCHLAKPLFYEALPEGNGFLEPLKYINLSVERTFYHPVPLEEIQRWVQRWSKESTPCG